MQLDKSFWSKRYKERDTGWDIGYVSTPIKEYVDQLTDKTINILIPGAGNSYEAEYLFNTGFKNVFVLDIAEEALKNLKIRNPEFPENQLILGDFFDHSGKYDLILEQTFFCALNPKLRSAYCKKMSELLNKDGVLVGVLFNIPLFEDHPPFGGNQRTYESIFNEFLDLLKMESCYNSIPPRAGNELFFVAKKKL